MKIDHAMNKLINGLASQNTLPKNPRMLAMFLDDPNSVPEEELRSFACIEVQSFENLQSPLIEKSIPAGQYAKLQYRGPYADMKEAYQWLYGIWLPQSGFEPADFPAIEEYLNSPAEVPQTDLLTNIWVPVK